MNPDRNHRALIEAVLAEGAPDNARDASLTATLGAVRQRRHQRRRRQRALIGSALALLLGFALWRSVPRPGSPAASARPGLVLVKTQPFSAQAILTTRPESVRFIASGASPLNLVHSKPEDAAPHRLSDDELLKLVSGQPIALVGAPGHTELVFGLRPAPRRLQ